MKLIPYFQNQTPARELMRTFWGVDEDGGVIAWAPRLDVHEDKDAYRIRLDLPGMDKRDIQIAVEDGLLTVSGTRNASTEDKSSDGTWHRRERHFGSFQRTLSLGDGVDANRVKAEHKDGVLSITVPKKETAKARIISID